VDDSTRLQGKHAKKCGSLGTHQWSQGSTTYLSLATLDGWLDVFRCWQCRDCGMQTWATGAIERGTPPLSPLDWQARADAQAACADPYAGAVKAQEQWERERSAASKRLRVVRKRGRR
jgi:hypothetical protein